MFNHIKFSILMILEVIAALKNIQSSIRPNYTNKIIPYTVLRIMMQSAQQNQNKVRWDAMSHRFRVTSPKRITVFNFPVCFALEYRSCRYSDLLLSVIHGWRSEFTVLVSYRFVTGTKHTILHTEYKLTLY